MLIRQNSHSVCIVNRTFSSQKPPQYPGQKGPSYDDAVKQKIQEIKIK